MDFKELVDFTFENSSVNIRYRILVVTGHGDSCIKLLFRTFTRWENCRQVKGELYEASLTALKEAGVEIPFPQVDVHMK